MHLLAPLEGAFIYLGGKMNFFEELKWRGLIKDVTDEGGFIERLKKPITLYCGFDPTADSLHIGSLQQLLLLRRYQLQGHRPIALLGGGTGMIGDPRPTSERQLLTLKQIRENGKKIRVQLDKFCSSDGDNGLLSLNNYDWLSQIDLLGFLRDYGKYFNVNYMIAKDTIASRLDSGISFTEFSYMILQSIDFLHLYKNYNCELQIGGSDQWGNLTSGTELIRKTTKNAKVYGVTSPLITNSDGSKFGKSEGQNIWLDAAYTSPYAFYQYWLNVADSDVIDFMKRLSMNSPEYIQSFEKQVVEKPHKRVAQIALAQELTLLVHGEKALASALKITEVFFSNLWHDLTLEELQEALSDAPSYQTANNESLIDVLVNGKIAVSKREARELIANSSISINGNKINDLDFILQKEDALFAQVTVIKKGKKTYCAVWFNEWKI